MAVFLKGMIEPTLMTLKIFALTLVFSVPLGWLLSLLRTSKNKIISKITWAYCWFFRGTPLVLQLALVYFGLPALIKSVFHYEGFMKYRVLLAIIAFTLNYAAYFAEIFRGGIASVNKGQLEAADVLGFSQRKTMYLIIFPQAIKNVLPSLGNELISLVKDTALVYTIGIAELSRYVHQVSSRTFRMEPFVAAAVVYLLLTLIISTCMMLIEKKLSYYK